MLQEQAAYPPTGVEYVIAKRRESWLNRVIRSPIKGFLPVIDGDGIDIVESIISPAISPRPWVCSVANFQEVLAFNVAGVPTPKFVRRLLVERLFRDQRFLGFAFWSEAGRKTMLDYGGVRDPAIHRKAHVIYPAVAHQPDRTDDGECRDIVLFSGDFFRKGGVHVVEAFERVQGRYPSLQLRLCCDPETDFRVGDPLLREEFLRRIRANPRIVMGRVPRSVMIGGLLPRSVAYLLPTYDEAFGFAILEAMAAGVPVIATREFAIPELVEDGKSGWLIDYDECAKSQIMRGYRVIAVPASIRACLSDQLTSRLIELLDEPRRSAERGRNGQRRARDIFSIDRRNGALQQIYAGANKVAQVNQPAHE